MTINLSSCILLCIALPANLQFQLVKLFHVSLVVWLQVSLTFVKTLHTQFDLYDIPVGRLRTFDMDEVRLGESFVPLLFHIRFDSGCLIL